MTFLCHLFREGKAAAFSIKSGAKIFFYAGSWAVSLTTPMTQR
jgi:hypothetical protein